MNEFRSRGMLTRIDWVTVGLFIALVLFGWINIYAAVYDPTKQKGFWDIFNLSLNSGKQLVWAMLTGVIIFVIMLMDFKLFHKTSYIVYGIVMVALAGVLLVGREVAGAKSWFDLGFARLQPSEFAKFATALAVSRFISDGNLKASKFKTIAPLLVFISIPAGLILMQPDTGSALVFLAFFIVFYREGLPQYVTGLGLLMGFVFMMGLILKERQIPYMAFGLAISGAVINLAMERSTDNLWKLVLAVVLSIMMIFGVNTFVSKVLKPHQQERIRTLLDPNYDPQGKGWQITQSKIAIGSGGFLGKGFLKGTQTKFDFVPDQSTDFIFCTIGEEWGWIGSLVLIALFVALMIRLLILAERQKSNFSRLYGYCVLAIVFFHFTINIGMTIGLFPVIGIPLPFFSYGGSSLWSFTVLLFILVKLDMHRTQQITR
jgi:rod shape determining protein RodA